MASQNMPTLYLPGSIILPDSDQWTNRFEIESETSNRVYIIAQHKIKKHWGCSCMGWKRFRKCKHLSTLDIPCHETPYQPRIITK